jgi:hypothetical protein
MLVFCLFLVFGASLICICVPFTCGSTGATILWGVLTFQRRVWRGLRVIWKWLKLCSSLRHFCLKVKKDVSNYLKMSQTILSQSNRKCLKLFCAPALQNDLYVHMYFNLELLPGLPAIRWN